MEPSAPSFPLPTHLAMSPITTTNNDFIAVRRGYLEFLQQHCCDCPRLNEQSRAFVQISRTSIPSAQPTKEYGSRKRKRATKGPWKKEGKARDYFLQRLPKATEWHKRQIVLVESGENYEHAICGFTKKSSVHSKEVSVQGDTRQEDELVTIVSRHIQSSQLRKIKASL
ncbi:hypothetical protein EJ02DRAFT_129917 [Clathrospora elynae]|uniref:Uncharacterized protein n=1 Tax=Clathrospora elynae TaxID=706981 RepID=A0A6A5SUX5_9PLEO|nr:hypothetical protein EJ02DRAFT_129917 [Clathrospora elynae]